MNTFNDEYLINLIDGVFTTDTPAEKHITIAVCPALEYKTTKNSQETLYRTIAGPIQYDPMKRIFVFSFLGYMFDGEDWKRSPEEDDKAIASMRSYADATTGLPVEISDALKPVDENGDDIAPEDLATHEGEVTYVLKDDRIADFEFVATHFGVNGTPLNNYLTQVMANKKGVTRA